MKNLSDRLKQASNESFDRWFDRWYKKEDWEHRLTISSRKGFNAAYIDVDKKDVYTQRRMLDERFIPKFKAMLGYGIEVTIETDTKSNVLGMKKKENHINIKW